MKKNNPSRTAKKIKTVQPTQSFLTSQENLNARALALHKKFQGKLATHSAYPVTDRESLSLTYTPGVAEPCRVIAADPDQSFDLTMRGRTVAVISDGSAVLGLGNIGPEAALPVMEGKSILLKEFAGVDSVPLVIKTQDSQEIIKFVKQVAPTFGAINLEDISAPRCFEIEEALQDIGIPVFHDDQHGTAIVVTAALKNAAKVVGKEFSRLKVVIVGSGAAGMATAKMLLGIDTMPDGSWQVVENATPVGDVIIVDTKGAIYQGREELPSRKQMISYFSNKAKKQGDLAEVIKDADVIIGVSKPGVIKPEMIKTMAADPIVFALANPIPEIMPDEATLAGAAIVATGRSDYANQINNVLAFPALFKAALSARATRIDGPMKAAASQALAMAVKNPTKTYIIPDPFTPHLAELVADHILKSMIK